MIELDRESWDKGFQDGKSGIREPDVFGNLKVDHLGGK